MRTQNIIAKPEYGATLPLVLLRCLCRPFLDAIVPRMFVILFRLSQPLLISRAIRFVSRYPVGDESDDRPNGYYIIVGTAVTYIGMAVSKPAIHL